MVYKMVVNSNFNQTTNTIHDTLIQAWLVETKFTFIVPDLMYVSSFNATFDKISNFQPRSKKVGHEK